MKAVLFEAVGRPLVAADVADPTPDEGQVVLRVCRCGICGTDLHMTGGEGYPPAAGSVLGHEFSGDVVAVGRGVDRVKVGDRVAALPLQGCGGCVACLAGDPVYCRKGMHYLAGGFAEYARAGEKECLVLPGNLSPVDGALAEPLAVSLHGVRMAPPLGGARVTIIGAGPIGLATVFWARRFGARRIEVIDSNPARRDMALTMGADHAGPPRDTTDGAGELAELVFECVGKSGLLSNAIGLTQPRGTVVSLGFCMLPESMTAAAAGMREVTIKFPMLYNLSDYEATLDALNRDATLPRAMVTDTVSLDALPTRFEELRKPTQHCKVMVDPRPIN